MAKNERIKMTISVLVNLAMITFTVVGYFIMSVMGSDGDFVDAGFNLLKYFTVLSNVYLAITAGVMIPFQIYSLWKNKNIIPEWVQVLFFTGICGIMLTFLVILFMLAPMDVMKGRSYFRFIFFEEYICMHFFNPMLAMASFFHLNLKPRIKFNQVPSGIFLAVLYGIFYITNNLFHYWGVQTGVGTYSYDWYDFWGDGNPIRILLLIVILIGGAYGISDVLWLLNNLARHYFEGYDEDEGDLIQNHGIAYRNVLLKGLETEGITENTVVYHVSFRLFRMKWQVRESHQKKPLALFSNKVEATEYARQLAILKKGVVRVHYIQAK